MAFNQNDYGLSWPTGKSHYLLLEGKDDAALFDEMLRFINRNDKGNPDMGHVQILNCKGVSNYGMVLDLLAEREAFFLGQIHSVAIVIDGDGMDERRYESVQGSVRAALQRSLAEFKGLGYRQFVGNSPRVGLYILPGPEMTEGKMMEDMIWNSLKPKEQAEVLRFIYAMGHDIGNTKSAAKMKLFAYYAAQEPPSDSVEVGIRRLRPRFKSPIFAPLLAFIREFVQR
jgi:hypothetical protein